MRIVWGARALAIVADKKHATIVYEDGTSKKCDQWRERVAHVALHPTMPYFVLSSASGEIQVIDSRTSKTFRNFKLDNGCAGVALAITSVFAANATNGEVVEWDLESAKEIKRFVADEDGLTCICAHQENEETEPIVACARTGITIWKNGKRISRFTGHSTSITHMAFLRNGALAALTAQERSISVWPANAKKSKHPTMELRSGLTLDSLSCGPRLSDGDEAAILATSKTGSQALLWRIPSVSESSEVAVLQSSSIIQGQTQDQAILLACDFSHKEGRLACLVQTKDEILPTIVQSSLHASSEAGGVAKIIIVGQKREAAAVSFSNVAQPAALKRLERSSLVNHVSEQDAKRSRAISSTSIQEDDRPMATRLAEFVSKLDETVNASSVNAVNERLQIPATLTVALEQALQTEDREKIEAVLQTTDVSIVSQTVQKLQPAKVSILLRELAIRLQGKPGRAGALLIWLNSTLEAHRSLIASDPAARDALRTVYAVADSRVQTFDKMLRLKGRLDLLLPNAGHGGNNAKTWKGPAVIVEVDKL